MKGFAAAMKAVFWSFFGVRKRKDYEHDAANLKPLHVILCALVGVAVFIGVLLFAVRLATANGNQLSSTGNPTIQKFV